ncbi:unnamed protein product [Brachionus calyciflorus]|uniref:Mannosyltransferase n=1 Tax=Brachionus calyciflorus TaxID=104777 RepID=A0A813NDF2_9BILA|nr:unnamed protein product [Brachionus calyciflorus]
MRKLAKKINETQRNDQDSSNYLFLYKILTNLNDTNIFMLFLTFRLPSVYYNLIWDCDETYNYWDPLHFLIFGQGTQTWEYSPVYALRSYLYLLIHSLPLIPFKSLVTSKITLFYLLRFIFALIQSYIDLNLFKSLKKLSKDDPKIFQYVHYFYLIFNLTNVGLFLSSTSFLPSSFSLYLITYAYSNIYLNNYKRSVLAIGLAVLLAWPFVAILGLPVIINFLLKKSILKFLKTTILFGLIIGGALILIDSYFYGKIVFAPLNIFMYNVLDTTGKGPDLYGREPFSYYLKNLFLNFNVLFPLSISSILLLLSVSLKSKNFSKNSFLTYLGIFLWLLVFMTRPHKEERFIYPIYELLIISSALSVSLITNFLLKKNRIYSIIPNLIILIHFLLSLSRLLALLFNYSSTISIYFKLNDQNIKFSSPHLNYKSDINVCVGKEWYRFPSYFFIPERTEMHEWNLKFLESDFKGQLPGYFTRADNITTIIESTRHIDPLFNDFNREVTQRYVTIDKCDFLIDTDNLSDEKFNKATKLNWKTLASLPFYDSVEKYQILRSFYIPFFYEKQVLFTFFKLKVRVP